MWAIPTPYDYYKMREIIIFPSSEEKERSNKMTLTKSIVLEHVIKTFPLPDQIREIDFDRESDAIRFSWRDTRFRLSWAETGTQIYVDECHEGFLLGSNISIVVEALLNKDFYPSREDTLIKENKCV